MAKAMKTRSFPSLKSNLKKGGRSGFALRPGGAGAGKQNAKVKGATKGGMKAGSPRAPKSTTKKPFKSLGNNEGFGQPKNASKLAKTRFMPMAKQGKRDTGMTLLSKAMGRMNKYGS